MDFYESKKFFCFYFRSVDGFFFFAALIYFTYTGKSYFMSAVFFLYAAHDLSDHHQCPKIIWRRPLCDYNERASLDPRTAQGKVEIRWDDIMDSLFYEISGHTYIGLVLADEEKYTEAMLAKMRRLSRRSQKMGYPMFNITFWHIIGKEELIKELSCRNPTVTIEM